LLNAYLLDDKKFKSDKDRARYAAKMLKDDKFIWGDYVRAGVDNEVNHLLMVMSIS